MRSIESQHMQCDLGQLLQFRWHVRFRCFGLWTRMVSSPEPIAPMDRRVLCIPASEAEAIGSSQLLTPLASQPLYGNCTSPSTTSVPIVLPTTTSSSKITTSSVQSPTTSKQSPTTTTRVPTTSTSTSPKTTALSALPSCGQTCFNNLQAQYSTLGCSGPDSYCLCNNPNFGYGLRDCANGACGTAVASTVIAYGNAYCSTALATHTTTSAAPTTRTTTSASLPTLPSCGQTCLNNMKAQYSALGCSSPDPACLCKNVNFGYGLRDCANGACGTAVAPTVISYGSSYCASATAKA
jgi:hypothetical protein